MDANEIISRWNSAVGTNQEFHFDSLSREWQSRILNCETTNELYDLHNEFAKPFVDKFYDNLQLHAGGKVISFRQIQQKIASGLLAREMASSIHLN